MVSAAKKNREKIIAPLVTRRSYDKQDLTFVEPNLLEIQKKSYDNFLKKGLSDLISSYFPINHPKNLIYEVRFNGIKFYNGKYSEEEARYRGKTYCKTLYVDLSLINNETGVIKTQKGTKGKKNNPNIDIHDGVFFAEIPMMTKNGTFIVNGIEKFVILQATRSPGAYILNKAQIKLVRKKKVIEGFICELLLAKGTIMVFSLDQINGKPIIKLSLRNATSDAIEVFSATQFLKAFGFSCKQIDEIFKSSPIIKNSLLFDGIKKSYTSKFFGCYTHQTIMENDEIKKILKSLVNINNVSEIKPAGLIIDLKLKQLLYKYTKLNKNLLDAKNSNAKKDCEKKIALLLDAIITEKAAMDIVNTLAVSKRQIENFCMQYHNFCYQDFFIQYFFNKKQYGLSSAGRIKLNHKLHLIERLYQKILAHDLYTKEGKVFLKAKTLINKKELDLLKNALLNNELDISKKFSLNHGFVFPKNNGKICDTVKINSIDVIASNNNTVANLVGGVNFDEKSEALTICDLLASISYTINLPLGIGNYDDIDHLGNKRIKLIHEQLKNKLIVGMAYVEKYIKDKLSSLVSGTMNAENRLKKEKAATIKSVVSAKPFEQAIKAFFNTYQLTQFIDQQNPLSELTNKRRISAMGDGGVRRDDPNLDVRDVHYSHYGRICPIETPEGMNIGLIMSLASFAKVDDNGFLITPYFKVENGVITKEVCWLNAAEEDEYIIGEATIPHDEKGKITTKETLARFHGTQEIFSCQQINYIDISPKQVVSIAASTIPFLENDDSARALMGANMQRQAVPLLKPYAPIIGTGSEYKIAHDSGLSVLSPVDGEVIAVDGKHLLIQDKTEKKIKINLTKFQKTNQNTCNNQNPIVEVGQKIKNSQVLADGPAMFNGELAIGRNPLIAYMTWYGYNFEDAIVISNRLIQNDAYTSIEIEEFSCDVIQNKNGDEEITRDLPNVSDDAKKYLNEDGIIMVGAKVKEGDVLVGKITPKGVVDYSPEEKLLSIIFGSKSQNYKDNSLKVKHGGGGIVIAVKHFRSIDGDLLPDDVIEKVVVYIAQKRKLQVGDKMSGRHGNKGTVSKIVPVEDMPHLEDGTPIDILLSPLGVPSRMNLGQILEVHLGWAMYNLAKKRFFTMIKDNCPDQEFVQTFGLPQNKVKILKKIANNYLTSNKISSVDAFKNLDLSIILNKVGLSHEDLSLKAETPVFMGAKLDDIAKTMQEAGIDPIKTKGKVRLIDGKTGEYFDDEVTVGVMYMLKLDHMVEDKIHARAVGPYSKITQQPLGGKSQNGGQRFGEMEVWALEAYGATHNLQELLTIKSDDVSGRNWTYNAIVKGKKLPTPSLPSSFKLLTKQLQGLCLAISVYDEKNNKHDINDFTATIINEKNEKKEEKSADSFELTDDINDDFSLL